MFQTFSFYNSFLNLFSHPTSGYPHICLLSIGRTPVSQALGRPPLPAPIPEGISSPKDPALPPWSSPDGGKLCLAPLCYPSPQTNMSKIKQLISPPNPGQLNFSQDSWVSPPKPSEFYSPIFCSFGSSFLLLLS